MNFLLELFAAVFLVAGGFFAFIAGLGIVRFRDLATRMHAATKAAGAAFALVLIAIVLRMPGWEIGIKAVVSLGFAFLTLPVAAHLLGRNAISRGDRNDGDEEGDPDDR